LDIKVLGIVDARCNREIHLLFDVILTVHRR